MFGFDIQEDESATRNVAHRVLRTLLTTNLPNLQPALQMKIKEAFDLEISNATTTGKPRSRSLRECFNHGSADQLDWRAIQSFEMARRTVVKLNSFTFVGEKLCIASKPLRNNHAYGSSSKQARISRSSYPVSGGCIYHCRSSSDHAHISWPVSRLPQIASSN